MLSSQASILIYGKDLQLLETRRQVVASSGARVCVAANPADFARLRATESIDLLILCHSVPEEECAHIWVSAKTTWAKLRTLSLFTTTSGSQLDFADEIEDTSLGPVHLLITVAKLLAAKQADHPRYQTELMEN